MANKEKEVSCVELDANLAELIEIRRFGEVEGGFQRKLNDRVLNKIVDTAKRGEVIPPIVLAKVDGKYRLLDGQHRFEAWKRSGMKFPLFAQINAVRATKAVESFCTINGTSRKVGLVHQLSVDPHIHAQNVRSLASRYGVELNVVHNLMRFAFSSTADRQPNYAKEKYDNVESIIKFWTNSPRWTSLSNKDFYYKKPNVLFAAAAVCRTAKHPAAVLSVIQQMDFSHDGPFDLRYGSDTNSKNKMRDYMAQYIVKHGNLVA